MGYLDDLLLVPLGLALAIRLIPLDLMAEFREEALARSERPQSRAAAAVIIVLWLLASAAVAMWVWTSLD